MNNSTEQHTTKGSSLMSVMIISVVSITVIGGMTLLMSLAYYTMSGWQQSLNALLAAESLADDVLLKVVRNPNTTLSPADILHLKDATAYPSLMPSKDENNAGVIVAKGVAGIYVRKVQVVYVVKDGVPVVLARQEIE